MSAQPDTDPRAERGPEHRDMRPLVALPRKGLPLWVMAAAMAVLAVLLFTALEARRNAASAPSAAPRAADVNAQASAVPSLFIPPSFAGDAPARPTELPPPSASAVPPRSDLPPPPMVQPPRYYPPPPPPPDWGPPPGPPAADAPARPTGTVLVYDALAPVEGAAEADAKPSLFGDAARASRLHNRSTTVPQGALIPAVLETAIDSSRPGFARAIVSRDVRGYDGTRVLIPRGSRLVGEYRSDATPGQKRALVTWVRLDRPDGVTIALSSPVADTAGRAGVRGSVDSHFFERFGAAFLQSALSIGQNLALRSADSSVVVALPGSFPGGAAAPPPKDDIPPTIKIKAGVSINVFVARDLSFTGVEKGR